jgi:hypothetical protein
MPCQRVPASAASAARGLRARTIYALPLWGRSPVTSIATDTIDLGCVYTMYGGYRRWPAAKSYVATYFPCHDWDGVEGLASLELRGLVSWRRSSLAALLIRRGGPHRQMGP